MKTALKHLGLSATVIVPASLLVRLGIPALAALVFIAVLALGVICWIIGSPDRSDRVTRMMLAKRGNARCLTSASSASPLPASQQRPPRVRSGTDATPAIRRLSGPPSAPAA